mmetsp:Transcript_26833/g.41955  ORF Transcript_26833/g.41955 Transcript_26833/m.41955 type:complete len:204 (-) Transcript_26833:43-654(-)
MQGFARAYDLMVPDDDEKLSTGAQVATDVYLPIHYKFLQELATMGAPKDKDGLSTGTQVFTPPGDNPGWFLEFFRERQKPGVVKDTWPIGSDTPEHWEEGKQYAMNEGTEFERNELVVLNTSKFGVVVGSNGDDIIVQVDEMSMDKNGGGFPYRVEPSGQIGKILVDEQPPKDLFDPKQNRTRVIKGLRSQWNRVSGQIRFKY